MHLLRFTGALALSLAFIPGAGAQGLVNPATEKKIDALLELALVAELLSFQHELVRALRALEALDGQLPQLAQAAGGPKQQASHRDAVTEDDAPVGSRPGGDARAHRRS